MDEMNEIFSETFKDTTSSTNITFQPKFIREILPKLYTLLVDEMPKEREKSYYHQNHWKADVYNEARTDCITALKRVLLGEK